MGVNTPLLILKLHRTTV